MVDILRDYIEYYSYGYDDDVIVIPGEEEVPPTREEIEQVVDEALGKINLEPNEDGRTYTLDIDGRDAGQIVIPDDKHLSGVETDSDSKEVSFKVVNGEDIRVSLDSLDDPNIDCSTF